MKEYKVINQKEGFYSGKFSAEKFEKVLNKYAGEGWRVVATSPVSVPSFSGNRQEIIVILERDYELNAIVKEPERIENNIEPTIVSKEPITNFEKTNKRDI